MAKVILATRKMILLLVPILIVSMPAVALSEEEQVDRSIRHVEPLTTRPSENTRVGVVQIPTGERQTVETRGNFTIVDNDPTNWGIGITVDLD